MPISLQDQLSFAQQGLEIDQQRLATLTEQRNSIADVGGDTSVLDSQISSLQSDVDAGISDVIDLTSQIEDEANAEQGDTAEQDIQSSDEPAEEESLDADEESSLADSENSNEGDEPPELNVPEMSADEKAALEAEQAKNREKLKEEEATTKKVEAGPIPVKAIRVNPLHQFATYTYSIALFLLTQKDINMLAKEPELWSPGGSDLKTCLIASGGKNAGAYTRNKNFTEDFYFDSLSMTTVIGLNNRSKSSNAIDLGFTVLEPYGMSLLDRVIDAAAEVNAPNFKAMPYLLEIEFYGYDDAGNSIKLDGQRKRIPIQIIEFKIKTTTKGSEYAIKAVPWNHQALSQSAATTPINVEVSASTAGEFFATNEQDYEAVTKQDLAKTVASNENQRIEKDTTTATTDKNGRANANNDPRSNTYKQDPSARTPAQSEQLKTNSDIIKKAYSVQSFCGGVNGWFSDLVTKRLRGTMDQVAVVFHGSPEVPIEKLQDAKITVPEHKDISRSATTTSNNKDAAAQSKNPANKAFGDAMAFPVAAGTSIPQVIDMVMRNSTYITDQISDPKDMKPADIAEKINKPLYWYKVVPSVEVLKYDFTVNKFATKTTYHIVPYIVYDSKHPNGPTAIPKGAVKKYAYTYTGKNVDVLDLQIDFDTLFYTAVTAGSAKWQADQIQKAKEQIDSADNPPAESPATARELVNRQLRLVSTQPQQQGLGGQQGSAQQILAGDIQKSQYSNSRGDMLNLKLKITGDPELIKQDDIYTNPLQASYATQLSAAIMPHTGSIPMDDGEVIAQVDFKTIVDMDERTGLPKVKEADKGIFSGQYRILTVANNFQGGKFEQTLDMVRVPDAVNAENNTSKKADATPAPKTDTSNSETAPDPAARETDSNTEDNGAEDTAPEDVDANADTVKPDPSDPNAWDSEDSDTFDPDAQTTDEAELEAIDENSEIVEADEWWQDGTEVPLNQPDEWWNDGTTVTT